MQQVFVNCHSLAALMSLTPQVVNAHHVYCQLDICDTFTVYLDQLAFTLCFFQRFYGRRKRRRRTAKAETDAKTTPPRVDSPVDLQSSVLMEEVQTPSTPSGPKVAATTCYFCIYFMLLENTFYFSVIIVFIRHKSLLAGGSLLCVCFLGRRNID